MPNHRRIVLQMQHGATSRMLTRQAAELARLMDLDMVGIFVEDEAVHGLASMPFARELRLPSHEWHPIDHEQMTAAFRLAALAAKRLLDSTAQGCGVACGFEIRRGDPAGVVADTLQASDIVVLAEPRLGSDGLNHSFLRSWRTATRSDASVLLLPSGPARRHGPVVLLVTTSRSRAVQTASHIAATSREILVLLSTAAQREHRDRAVTEARSAGVPAERIELRDISDITESALRYGLADHGERLLVLDRDSLNSDQETAVLRMAAARCTPVLLVGSTTGDQARSPVGPS